MNQIAIISGSHKETGASDRVAIAISEMIKTSFPDSSAEIVSIKHLPFWDEGMWGDAALEDKWEAWKPISASLKKADAFVFIAPEYGGMAPPKLSNFLLLCSSNEVGHKPALAVGVSASRGGAYPITQLRSYGYKNNKICWIPDHVIIRNVENDTSPLPTGSFENRFTLYCLSVLDAYASALKGVRSSGALNLEDYPHGM